MLLRDFFRRRGLTSKVELHLYTPEPQPMPVAGPELGAAVREMLENRQIGFHPSHKLTAVDPEARELVFDAKPAARYDLLVAIPPGASADETEAARAKALSLLARARAGEDFSTLVRAETAEPGSGADPVSGEIARGELFPALEDAAFALTVGGISEPVQSPAGFHLVQLAEKTPAYEPTLEEVRASIEQKIVDRKTRARYEDWLKQLHTDAIVEIRY